MDSSNSRRSRPTRESAGFPVPVGNPVNETASYSISATFCSPGKSVEHSKTVLLATHGLALDRSHWNSPYEPDNYNFVQFAVNRGYSVFLYDRLGVGSSTKHVNIGISVRDGAYTTIGKPTYLVLVSHAFGSFISNALVARDPNIADASILTGYALNRSNAQVLLEAFAPRIARLQRPRAFSVFDSGHITTADIFGIIQPYFKAGTYDRAVAAFVEATKQPFAIGELFSFSSAFVRYDAPNFKGPTLIIAGEYDFSSCGGYCPGVIDEPLYTYFRGSSDFQSYIQPKNGHGLNFAINATGFYGVIVDFLLQHDF